MSTSKVFQYMRDSNIRRLRIKNSTAYMMRSQTNEWELLPLEKKSYLWLFTTLRSNSSPNGT